MNGNFREFDLPIAERVGPRCCLLLLGVHLLSWGSSSSLGQLPRSARLSSIDLTSTVQIDELEQSARVHLERVQQFLDAGQWSEAVVTLRRVLDSEADRLVAISDAGDQPLVRYVTTRQYCQWMLSRWHETAPEALAQYRREVDAVARRWYEEGVEQGDEAKLREVVEQFFVSSSGDRALLLLGEHALERGDYTLARHYWERISPRLRRGPREGSRPAARHHLAPGRPRWLAWRGELPSEMVRLDASVFDDRSSTWFSYPDSALPLADIQARLILVSLMEGHEERAAIELELLRQAYPDATGTISGREGPYVEQLKTLTMEARDWQRRFHSDVITFGSTTHRIPIVNDDGNADRRTDELDISGPPLWRIPLPRISAEQDLLSQNRLRTAEAVDGALSYHPIVVGATVLVPQMDAVRAFQLRSGRPLLAAESDGEHSDAATNDVHSGALHDRGTPPMEAMLGRGRYWGVPRHTLTANERWLFARMGTPVTRWRNLDSPLREVRSHLVGLDLATEGRLLPGYPLYADNIQWSFEGTPLVAGNLLYVAMRRQDDVRVESHVACFEAASGRLIWRRMICAAETPAAGLLNELTHSLLTMEHGTIYFNTHLGAVCALEAATGEVCWLATYPRASYPPQDPDDPAIHHFRDLTPAIVSRGVAVFAPSDCRQLFAVDAASGQLLWALPVNQCADVKHLLGVAEDRLIVSGNYLYWIDLYRGELLTQFPSPRHHGIGYASADPRGYGRGMLHGERIYWPTRERIFVFRQEPQAASGGWLPVMARAPIDLHLHGAVSGNLVAAPGILLIAGPDELLALRAGGSHDRNE